MCREYRRVVNLFGVDMTQWNDPLFFVCELMFSLVVINRELESEIGSRV